MEAGASSVEAGSRLRASGVAADEVAAVLTELDLRDRARAKFGEAAATMYFTRAGLEQATRASVAALHARRFAEAGVRCVADLGCGIGSESIALLSTGIEPSPVEIDPFTAAIAGRNIGRPVRIGDAETIPLTDLLGPADGVFLDPARRTSGHSDTRRLRSADEYSPSLGFAFGIAAHYPTGIKLGPGFVRDRIPADAEAQWVSVDGQLVETGLWFGSVARTGIRRAALVIRGEAAHELTATEDAPDAEVRGLGDYLYEPDGAVIRARLIGRLAADLGAGMLSSGIAYLSSETRAQTPFAAGFRIIDELPSGEKGLRRALADRGIGRLEIKKRGVPVDPARLRSRLRLTGPNHGTLIMTRTGERHRALLVERLD